MDPCPCVRITVGNLSLRIPVAVKPASSAVHPLSAPCFCKIKLKNFPIHTAVVPCTSPESSQLPEGQSMASNVASFDLSKSTIAEFASGKVCLKISIFSGQCGANCGFNSGRLIGKVTVPLDLTGAESRACVFHSGWISVGRGGKASQFHLTVKAEPDPRFVFQFDGEPECSPQVFQIQGSIRQPVFTCKFSLRSTSSDRNQLSRSLPSERSCSRSWLGSLGSEKERSLKERKGWSLTVHDLSGSPVATASMVTPFVASPGSDRVSRSNPGSWLILRPGDGTWKPWGRLEAWRERGGSDGLGYRFELIPGSAAAGIVLAESTISSKNGGEFSIDLSGSAADAGGQTTPASANSPAGSPRVSHGNSLWTNCMYRGFVMSARVEGEGKCSKPTVQVSVPHVGNMEDAAAFVALAAAVDLSIDACRLFSQRLRKELCQNRDLIG